MSLSWYTSVVAINAASGARKVRLSYTRDDTSRLIRYVVQETGTQYIGAITADKQLLLNFQEGHRVPCCVRRRC